jgi:hypothetical protein
LVTVFVKIIIIASTTKIASVATTVEFSGLTLGIPRPLEVKSVATRTLPSLKHLMEIRVGFGQFIPEL